MGSIAILDDKWEFLVSCLEEREPWEKQLMDELSQFIQASPDSRELKRASAVQMVLQDGIVNLG